MTKLAVGDVFLVPLDSERCGIGQLAGNWKGELYVVIYDKLVSRDASPADISGADLRWNPRFDELRADYALQSAKSLRGHVQKTLN